ncbi:unnamed protein product [Pleuronectes platessa]|uniref:Uncharacterized protein n=1 Tax=Pleuronectes platessa TaxID=8262 RepID=A0A9N7UN86_PLEPL|nr:unnamed protein product [Pleuronectes platessa]
MAASGVSVTSPSSSGPTLHNIDSSGCTARNVFIPGLGGGAPLPLHQDRMLVSALHLLSLPPPPCSTFAFICRFFLRCSLHLRYPRGQAGGGRRGREKGGLQG